MSLVSVIIVNYRSGESLKSCLASLFECSDLQDLEILVVNNDLPEDLEPASTLGCATVNFIQNPSNLGFAAATNIGFRRSQGDFILLLNPDVQVRPRTIQMLIETLRNHSEAGVVLPQLRHPNGSLQYSCRRFYTYFTLLLRRYPWNRLFPEHPAVRRHLMMEWDHDTLREVDWGLGGAMMVRRSAVPESQLFDERFFLYFEDVDLCLAMRQRGWKVLYNPAAVMIHRHRRESATNLTNPAKAHHLLSLIKFILKHRFRLGYPEN